MEDARPSVVEFGPVVQGTAIVPQQNVACAPGMCPNELVLRRVTPKPIQQGLALLVLQADDVIRRLYSSPSQIEGLAARVGMNADERMCRAFNLLRFGR